MFEQSFKDAFISFDGSLLCAATSCVEYRWQVTANGLASIWLSNRNSKSNLLTPQNPVCDWKLQEMTAGKAELKNFHCHIHYDDMIDSDFLKAELEFHYPEWELMLRCQIRLYPGAPGVWTQLAIRTALPLDKMPCGIDSWPRNMLNSYTGRLPIAPEKYSRLAYGYYCDSQHRYYERYPILKEERHPAAPVSNQEIYDFANGLILTDKNGESIILVKESHKCVNSHGVDTGAFLLDDSAVEITGCGLGNKYISNDYRSCWANWYIVSENAEKGAALAIKTFDRCRFPFRKKRDMLLCANTWGSHGKGKETWCAANEKNILREIDSCADLGIELLQIDDGWEYDHDCSIPFAQCDWSAPHPSRFPNGWSTVWEYAASKKVALGLWFPWSTPTSQILQNRKAGNFRRFKLDFADLKRRELLDELITRVDELVRSGAPEVGINFDITEIEPRVGFYFARQYGNIFLQNSENPEKNTPVFPIIQYDPAISLRQMWLLARYMNLNQLQCTVQQVSDSPRSRGYGQDYGFGIAMMGLPLFFLETQKFTPAERAELKKLTALYLQHREAILTGFTHPIGNEPDNKSWTGFQCVCSGDCGYLTIFREIGAQKDHGIFTLDAPGESGRAELTDLRSGEIRTITRQGENKWEINGLAPGEFAFYQYRFY